MNILAPNKFDILFQFPEGNCMDHYHMKREWDSAYWAAIYMAYRNRKDNNSGIRAWDMFSDYVDHIPSCGS